MVVQSEDWVTNTEAAVNKAADLLRECGFAYLDNFYSPATVRAYRAAYEDFKRSDPRANEFLYPCQGRGRVEHMLPFASPFNDTLALHGDPRLHRVLLAFLRNSFKLELITVINSPPDSGEQRWHQVGPYLPPFDQSPSPVPQGWRYLFHPEERLPPYAVVVGVPLADVSVDMGPTQAGDTQGVTPRG